MARVSEPEVRDVIDDSSDISIAPFIATATVLTDYVDRCDTADILKDAQLKEIERWLAAHYYAIRDAQYRSKATGRAEAEYQVGKSGEGSLDSNDWGRQALMLDVTGCLARLNEESKTGKKPAVSLLWLGKPPSEQIDYVDRD